MAQNRGKPKPSSRDLNRGPLSDDEHLAVENAFFGGPPVVTAIIGASIIEYELDDLLRSRLTRNDDDTWKLMTGENGPFAHFSGKIISGHALGMYDYSMVRNLTVVRNIRNAFAHAQRIIDFDHPLIASEFGKIVVPIRKNSKDARNLSEARNMTLGDTQSYVSLCTYLSTTLMHRSVEIARQRARRLKQSANTAWKSIYDILETRPELIKVVQQLHQENQTGDPTFPVRGLSHFASLGRMPRLPRRKDK